MGDVMRTIGGCRMDIDVDVGWDVDVYELSQMCECLCDCVVI